MSFLTLNGQTVRCAANQVSQKDEEHRLDRERMFDGTLRMTRGAVFRSWEITGALLTESAANTLLPLIRANAILTASGDLVGDDVAVMPIPGSDNPVITAQGYMRRVTFGMKETGGPLPPDTSAVPHAFFQRGRGYLKGDWVPSMGVVDYSACTAAGDGDLVSVWQDQSGNGFHLLGGINPNTLNHYNGWDPTRDGVKLRFGQGSLVGAPGGGGTADGRSYFARLTAAWWNALTKGEIMVSIQAVDATPSVDGTNRHWTLGGSGATGSGPYFPKSDGHLYETVASEITRDLGTVPTGVDLAGLNVYDIAVGLVTDSPNWTARINNSVIYSATDTTSGYPFFDSPAPAFGQASQFFDGWYRDLVIFSDVLTDAQRRSWYDYLRGVVDDPPLP